MPDAAEWVTIAEAARRLGIEERQARRVAGRLSADDRTAPETRPAKVRWAALGVRTPVQFSDTELSELSETGEVLAAIGTDQAPTGVQPASELSGHPSAELSGQSPAELSEVSETIVPLSGYWREQMDKREAEIAAIYTALLNAQKLHWTDQQELLELRERAALLPAPAPERRGWLATMVDKIRRRT